MQIIFRQKCVAPQRHTYKKQLFSRKMHTENFCLRCHKYFCLNNIAQYYEFACGHSKTKIYLWSSIFIGHKFSFMRNFKKKCRNFCLIHFSEYLKFFFNSSWGQKKLFGRTKIIQFFIKKIIFGFVGTKKFDRMRLRSKIPSWGFLSRNDRTFQWNVT